MLSLLFSTPIFNICSAAAASELLAPREPATELDLFGTLRPGEVAQAHLTAELGIGTRNIQASITNISNNLFQLDIRVFGETVFLQFISQNTNAQHIPTAFPLTLLRTGDHLEIESPLSSIFRDRVRIVTESSGNIFAFDLIFGNVAITTADPAVDHTNSASALALSDNSRTASALTAISFENGQFVGISEDGRRIQLPRFEIEDHPQAIAHFLSSLPGLLPLSINTNLRHSAAEGGAATTELTISSTH